MKWLDDLTRRAIVDGLALYRADLYRTATPRRQWQWPTPSQAILLMAYTVIASSIEHCGLFSARGQPMKFLTGHTLPALTITHTRRRCITDQRTGIVDLTESVLRLELTLPSMVAGFKQAWRRLKTDAKRAWRDALTPDLAHYVGAA